MSDPKEQPSEQGYAAAAWLLMVEVRAMKAIAQVETKSDAFLPTREPVILFERHKFHEHTHGRFSRSHPELSHPLPYGPGEYGTYSEQHGKLQRAEMLDRDAALKSCSWGAFQIMGENHVQAGYPILQRFINAMYRSVDDHLRAFVMFVRNDTRLVDAMRSKDWMTFARVYNGAAFARSRYDVRMAEAYERLV